MKERDDFLVEILAEELPPKALIKLANVFGEQIKDRLQKADLYFAELKTYATPRRLAVFVKELAAKQPDQIVERKGPAREAAFDASGKPSQACIGFAKSVGVTPQELTTIKTPQGEWVGFKQKVAGKTVKELLPAIIEQAIAALPIPKRMRWGSGDTQFSRPVHSVVLLFGDDVIDATILGLRTGRVTQGHRFHAKEPITIPHAATYETLLETEGHVVADFAKRREKIRVELTKLVRDKFGNDAIFDLTSSTLLDEVTGLVEWPVSLIGNFDKNFLEIPVEVLISVMQDHQRYFPIYRTPNELFPSFGMVSNILSQDDARVIHGNERVLRARLSDAAFFYVVDKKESLEERLPLLKGIIFQAKLGTVYEQTERIRKIGVKIAKEILFKGEIRFKPGELNVYEKLDNNHKAIKSLEDLADVEERTATAALLAKTDLTTNMVVEFPELEGVMGYYYAKNQNKDQAIAIALKEQYLPRFSGDSLPKTTEGKALAIANRVDTLVGNFGINQIPTGEKDPFGLRRSALGVLRILIEENINLDLKELLKYSADLYGDKLTNSNTVDQILNFMQERLRAYYQERNIPADVFASVAALQITNPFDADKRIKAVQAFKKLDSAEALSIANKRVSNILTKYEEIIEAKSISPALFENDAEKNLAQQLEQKSKKIKELYDSKEYDQVLLQLSELRKPIDDFFDHVMVMTDNKSQRENRILLLKQIRMLFSQVADIALLQ